MTFWRFQVRRVETQTAALLALFFLGCGGATRFSCSPAKKAQDKKVTTVPKVRSERLQALRNQPRRPSGPPADAKKVTLLYSSNLDGEYEAHPLGGLARRATMTKKIQAAGPTLQVDAGDSLLPRLDLGPNDPPPDPAELERRARLMATGLGKLGLDAFTPGEQELLTLGPAKVAALAKKAGLPVLSNNILDKKGKPWFTPYKLIDRGGTKIGLFGITTLAFEDGDKAKAKGFTLGDPLGAAQGATSLLREKGAQVVVALVHVNGSSEEARDLVRKVDGLDVLVVGHGKGKTNQRIRSTGRNIRVLQADRRGRLIGQLDIYAGSEGVVYQQEYHRMDTNFVSDDNMLALVKPYVAENKKRIARKLPVGATARAGSKGELASASEEKWTYASDAACALCHPQAKEHFLTTSHAFALATLERKGRQRDPDCLRCHSTGFDRPGGTRNLTTAATFFGGVGCESCHGPSAAHVRAQDKTGTRRMVPEQVCVECHTKEQSPEPFDYIKAIREVLGKGHGSAGPTASRVP
jgi:2',3'-cyclic-nucleotide 2'-phosphodiesterase (5'-nucleotidase family)